MRIQILATLAVVLTPATAMAGDLAGKVYDATALPVAGAVVVVDGREALTDADGNYSFPTLEAGEHEVAVTLANGSIQRVFAQVGDSGTARRNVFLLSPAAMRSAQAFARSATSDEAAPTMPVDLPAASGVAVAWQWRDSDA